MNGANENANPRNPSLTQHENSVHNRNWALFDKYVQNEGLLQSVTCVQSVKSVGSRDGNCIENVAGTRGYASSEEFE